MLELSFDEMYQLCNKNQWFTDGSNEQYSKLFQALEEGCPEKEIVTIIWVCSDGEKWCRRDIKTKIDEFLKKKEVIVTDGRIVDKIMADMHEY